MSELILKGTDLFMGKTGIADTLSISGNTERILFLLLGILLVFAGAKVYRLIVSFIMFWGVTIVLCTVMNGRAGWGTIVTAAAFFPLEEAILSSVVAGTFLLHEMGVRYVALLTVCGLLFQIVLFERKSERGRKIWKRFFAKKSNI